MDDYCEICNEDIDDCTCDPDEDEVETCEECGEELDWCECDIEEE